MILSLFSQLHVIPNLYDDDPLVKIVPKFATRSLWVEPKKQMSQILKQIIQTFLVKQINWFIEKIGLERMIIYKSNVTTPLMNSSMRPDFMYLKQNYHMALKELE